MNIQESVRTCFTKFADFTGRASRPEYWWFVLVYVIAVFVGALIHRFVQGLVVLVFIVPLIAVGARRQHDIGKTGWLLLLGLIPLANFVLLYFTVQPSQPETNQWGAPPTTVPAG